MSPDHPAIRVSHLGKKYTIGGPQEKYLTFRDAIVNSMKAPFRRFALHSPQPAFRALPGTQMPGVMIRVSIGVVVVLLIFGAFSFRKMEQ